MNGLMEQVQQTRPSGILGVLPGRLSMAGGTPKRG
jgi:hypothetical protein